MGFYVPVISKRCTTLHEGSAKHFAKVVVICETGDKVILRVKPKCCLPKGRKLKKLVYIYGRAFEVVETIGEEAFELASPIQLYRGTS